MAFIQKVQQSFKKFKQKYANKMMSTKCVCACEKDSKCGCESIEKK